MTDWIVVLVGVAIICLLVVLVFRSGGKLASDGQSLSLLQQQVTSLSDTMNRSLGEGTRQMTQSLTDSQKLIKDITVELEGMRQIGVQTGQFADQLRSLQDVLINPKTRGVFGEHMLERVLEDVLGAGSYEMQYAFSDNTRVDAVIRVGERLVPIDAKFPLENYNRLASAGGDERAALEKALIVDLKGRINETAKYVRPEEGTLPFAFMFIPAEGIYYDLLTNKVGGSDDQNLIRHAASKKVIIVSPTTLFAYLQTVQMGLKALQIERDAELIRGRVEELGKHIGAYEESHRRLGKSLGAAVGNYNDAYRELGKIDKDVLRLTGTAIGIEVQPLDRPGADA